MVFHIRELHRARRVLVIAAAPALGACAHIPARNPDSVLRVMTYNIRAGNDDLARTADAIAALNPDIVALQEVDVHWSPRSGFADQATELGKKLHMNVRFAHIYDLPPTSPAGPGREFGVALLSRFRVVSWKNHVITRLSTQEEHPLPAPMPGFLEADVDVHGTMVRVFDTHLDYRADPSVRTQQVRDMLAIVGSASAPVILMGDLNATPDAPELRPLRETLRDAWSDALGPGPTYPAESPEKRIDAILLSGHFLVRSAAVPPILASDHRPVVADLTLNLK